MSPVDLRPASEQPRMRDLMAAGLPMGQPEAWLHRRKDGGEFPVELVRRTIRYGDLPAVFAVAFDVSLRVQAERENTLLLAQVRDLNSGLEAEIARRTSELSQQEALFRTLAEQAPEPIWTVDPRGRATFFSQAWYELVGGESPQWHGSAWLALVHPDDVAPMTRNWLEASRSGNPYRGTRRMRARDGKYHTTSYRASPVRGEDGAIAFWVGIDADITELKEVEAALLRSNEELQAFSYSVSHDLRSPLTTLDGFSRLLAAEFQGSDSVRVRHYLARIRASILQMGQLIDGLLALAQVSRGELRREPVDLGALAGEILARLQAGEPDRVHRFRIEPGLIAQADSRMMRSVLENLLANAWKFSGRRDCTEITVGYSSELDAFSVGDNGAGFDMAYADKLFTPFHRLHAVSDFAGTGVGLATVGRVISRHGGSIWAQSAPDRGATFYFTLPAAG
jgi:PAS domain S-box-containing protein